MHQSKNRRAEIGVPENILKPRPLECRKAPLLENTCFFLLNFYKKSGSEKISITIKKDEISLRVIKHQANQVRKYIISLNKIKHLESEQKWFPVKKNCYYKGVNYPKLR